MNLMGGSIDLGMNELVLSQINEIKVSISRFMDSLSEYSKSNKLNAITQQQKNFFIFISKQILFIKEIYNYCKDRKLKVLISDYYNYIVSIIKNENRYLHLNERSIIEGYTRWIVSVNIEQNHVTSELIEQLKDNTYINPLTNDEYSLIKSEYIMSCGFIHGSNVLDHDLSYVFQECVLNNSQLKNINNYLQKIIKIIKIYNRLIISNQTENIDTIFWSRKSLLEYLIGKDNVEILFDIRN